MVPTAGPCRGGGAGLAPRSSRSGPRKELSLTGPSGVGLGLPGLRWFACVDPVTDASGFSCRLSFDGGFVRTPTPPLSGLHVFQICMIVIFRICPDVGIHRWFQTRSGGPRGNTVAIGILG